MITCNKCGKEKKPSEFYRGQPHRCRECVKEKSLLYYHSKYFYDSEYRSKALAYRHRRWVSEPEYRERKTEYTRLYMQRKKKGEAELRKHHKKYRARRKR
jgi:hypothetical protein